MSNDGLCVLCRRVSVPPLANLPALPTLGVVAMVVLALLVV